jgi:hypothetical protein
VQLRRVCAAKLAEFKGRGDTLTASRDPLQMSWRRGNDAPETLVALRELRAAVLARQKVDLRNLYREREIQKARAVERDPTALLNLRRPRPHSS